MTEIERLVPTFNCADALYRHALRTVLTDLHAIEAAPRGLKIKEVLGPLLVLKDPARCVVTLPGRDLNYHFMVAEWWWIASGDDRVESIAPYNQEIAKFSDDGVTFFGAYGPRWLPQARRAIELLKSDPDSRQAVVSTWRPNDEWLKWVESNAEEGRERWLAITKDVPCTLTMQYLLRAGELHCIVTMRSSDAWLGLPYDLFNFAMLQRGMAAELGVKVGVLQLQLGSLHLYERDCEKAIKLLASSYWYDWTGNVNWPAPTRLSPLNARWNESQARRGELATGEEPWLTFLEVLAHREHRDLARVRVDNPFRALLARRRS